MSLAHQRGGTKGTFSTIITVAELLTLVPSGCLLIANSNPLPEFALQTLHSSTQPLTHLRVGLTGHRMDHLCRSHSVLPATNWLLHSLLSTPSVPAYLPTSEGASTDVGPSPLL